MSSFCSSNFQFSYSQIDKVTYVTSCYRLTTLLTVFDASRIGTYDSVCLKGFGMEQVITQLTVKILFDDYSGFYETRRTIILPKN